MIKFCIYHGLSGVIPIIYQYLAALAEVCALGVLSSFVFTPQPLRAVGYCFFAHGDWWVDGQQGKVCPGYISETIRCRKLILGGDIGWGM